MMWVAPRGAHGLMRMAVVGRRTFSLKDKAVDVPHVDRRWAAHRGSAVGPGCFCRSSIKVRAPCAVSVPARLQEGAGDERGPAPESGRKRTHERADRALDDADLRPARRSPWRIRRWRFKGLTGDDRTRCAACWRPRDVVVAEPRLAFVGLAAPAGTERAPPRPLTPDGAFIPAWVDLRQDGAPEGIEFLGAGAPCAPQFRFGPLDCVGGSEARDEFGDCGAEGALQQALFLS